MILMQLNTTASSSSCFFYLSTTIPEYKPSQHNTRSIAMSSSQCKKHRSQQEHLFLTLCQERSSAVLPPSLHLRPFSPGACARQVLMLCFQRAAKMGLSPMQGKGHTCQQRRNEWNMDWMQAAEGTKDGTTTQLRRKICSQVTLVRQNTKFAGCRTLEM